LCASIFSASSSTGRPGSPLAPPPADQRRQPFLGSSCVSLTSVSSRWRSEPDARPPLAEFGLDTSEGAPNASRNEWYLGLVNGAPYLCCAVAGCWLTAPLNNWYVRALSSSSSLFVLARPPRGRPLTLSLPCRLGRRGTIFLTATISALTCIWCVLSPRPCRRARKSRRTSLTFLTRPPRTGRAAPTRRGTCSPLASSSVSVSVRRVGLARARQGEEIDSRRRSVLLFARRPQVGHGPRLRRRDGAAHHPWSSRHAGASHSPPTHSRSPTLTSSSTLPSRAVASLDRASRSRHSSCASRSRLTWSLSRRRSASCSEPWRRSRSTRCVALALPLLVLGLALALTLSLAPAGPRPY